ncbi:cupin domain-containing carboxymuconolactone decarboxylase family protein [Gallaecimonas sp. GXIMD1310]|uniref:cupin domain-containing carboxymuconolactone decarboxylase family protein n=1 Tax=Gallaecimonas sp. GXIMD1310 TaxID=3131926 RepID=UPI00324C6FD6
MSAPRLIFKTLLFAFSMALAFPGLAAATPGSQQLYLAENQAAFAGTAAHFRGTVQVKMLFPGNATAHYSGAYVTFAPAARTAWHRHPAGQHIIVTRGTALTATRAGQVIAFHAGDSLWCPPNVDHWHGATAQAPMTHLVITASKGGNNVRWLEQVNDQTYQSAINSLPARHTKALTPAQQQLIRISAYTASGEREALIQALHNGLDAGLSINEIKEAQLHLYAYAGFPRALNGLGALMTVLRTRQAQAIEDKTGPVAQPFTDRQSSLKRGTALQTKLSGAPVQGPLFDFFPAINTFLQLHLFGDLFGRGVLTQQSRELVTLSALANMERVTPQLQAHIRIASNAGVTPAQLQALTAVLHRDVGRLAANRFEQALNAAH